MKTVGILLILLVCAAAAENPAGSDAPIAPIAPTASEGWTNAITLRNASIELTVVPAIGRIVKISHRGGGNLLRLDSWLAGREPDASGADTWLNFGGDWFWPVAQSRWKDLASSDWPPPPVLAERPWSATAWKAADGTLCCRLSREYGEPLNLTAGRLIRLDPGAARVTIRQTLTRTAPSQIPATLWNVSQVAGAERVILPVNPEPPLSQGFKPLLFAAPAESNLAACAETVVYDTQSGEHKLCSESKRAWIAALKDETILVERAEAARAEGSYPDGGCTVEMYSNTGLGYSEIETLSLEKNLAPGETLQNTLTIECLEAPAGAEPCALAEYIRKALGELGSGIPPVK